MARVLSRLGSQGFVISLLSIGVFSGNYVLRYRGVYRVVSLLRLREEAYRATTTTYVRLGGTVFGVLQVGFFRGLPTLLRPACEGPTSSLCDPGRIYWAIHGNSFSKAMNGLLEFFLDCKGPFFFRPLRRLFRYGRVVRFVS